MIPISARAAIMQALISGSGYGIGLAGRIRLASGGAVALSDGALYTILRDLEAEGLVKSHNGEPRRGRPRIYYKLTAGGRKAALKTRDAVLGLFGPEEEGEGIL